MPTSGQWRTDSVSLNSYIGQPNVLIAFQNINGYGNKLYLDNINIVSTCSAPTTPTVTASANTTCSGQSTTLSVTSGTLNSATNWHWYSGSCGGTFLGTGNTITVAPLSTTTYYARGEGGCVTPGSCVSKTITVIPLPVVTANNVSGCAGTSIQLSGTPPGSVFNVANPYTGPSTTFTHSFTDSNGCVGVSPPATITVNPLPNVTANASPNDSICLNDPLTLSGNGASFYTWSNAVTNAISFLPSASSSYTVTGTDANNCTASAIIPTVVFNQTPSVIGGSRCGPGTVPLSASETGILSWYVNPTGGSPVFIGPNYSPSLSSTTTYYVDNTHFIGSTGSASSVGPLSNSIGSGLQSVLNQWLNFDVVQPCILQSVVVYPGTAGNVILEQRNSTGTTVLNTTTMAVTAGQIGAAVTMTLNWPLTPGTGYRVYRGSTGVSLYRTSTGAVYPYINPAVSITGNSLNPTYYFWAYNWTVSTFVNNYCTSTRVPVTATINNCASTVNLKLFLEGYYTGSNTMQPVLMNEGIGNSLVNTDSIDVELRNAASPYGIAGSTRAILQTNGTATCLFPPLSGSYYIAVKHRNTLFTWSANPVAIGALPVMYDFSDAATKAYGSTMTEVNPGVWAFYNGDLNQDENMDLLDANLLEVDINNFIFGYFTSDLNGDGNVDLLDNPILENNINNFIFSNHP